MKIRVGFVSNSSSASFVLHTDFSIQDFKEMLLTEETKYFSKEGFIAYLEFLINDAEQILEKHQEEPDNNKNVVKFWEQFNEQTKGRIKVWQKLIEKVDGIGAEELITLVFENHGYKLEENQMKRASIHGHTSMYNDENDFGELFLAIRDLLETKYGHASWMLEVDEQN